MKADLHVHTNISDSSVSIDDTMKIAKQNGLTHIGIVDHDTIVGLEEARRAAEGNGICLIPGIEISAYSFERDKKVHILGYNFDLQVNHIKAICDPIIKRRHEKSLWQARQIINAGYNITIEQVLQKARSSACLYKQHIMHALMDAGYTKTLRGALYQKLFKNGGICEGDIEYADVIGAVEAIKADHGVAVLAHPGQLDSYDLIEDLVKAGLDGIELKHESHCAPDEDKIKKYQKKYDLILTGGTDYHGEYGTNISMGSIVCPEEYIRYVE